MRVRLGPVHILGQSARLTFTEQRWALGEDQGWLWVVRMQPQAQLTVHPSASVALVRDLTAPPANDEALLNGGFYDEGPMGLVLHQGEEAAPWKRGGGSGIVYGLPAGGIGITHRDDWPPTPRPTEALQSIDRLVDAGQTLVNPKADARKAARSGIARTDDGVLLALAAGEVDLSHPRAVRGPRDILLVGPEAAGPPLWAFADMLLQHHAEQALNMDGGISSEMWVRVQDQTWGIGVGIGTINAVRLSAPRGD